MAHELTIRQNGTVEMAYAGAVPWHGLGAKLDENTDLDTWIKSAGMDWRIQRAKVRFATERNQEGDTTAWGTMDDNHVLMRSDTKAPLGIVSDNYKVVQPKAVLEFFRDLVGAAGFTLSTAGTLFGGRRFWALASIGDAAMILDPRDKVKGNLLLCTSADGTMATEARFVSERVVCANTLAVARGEGSAKVKITHRSVFREAEVKKELGVNLGGEFETFIGDMRRLATIRLSDTAMMMATAELLKPGAAQLAADELATVLKSKPVQRINELAIDQRGAIGGQFEGVRGTAWGWLNAVTQYVDHDARARSQDNRLNSAWFGTGDGLKTRARELVMAGGETVERIEDQLAADGGRLLDSVLQSWSSRK